MKTQLIFILMLIFSVKSFSQINDSIAVSDSIQTEINVKEQNSFGIITSFYLGKYSYGEVGFSYSKYVHGLFGIHHFISSEFKLGDKFVMGPKIGVWVGSGMAFGLNAIYYTDFDDDALIFRPEIGFGIGGLKVIYGYNWNLTNRDFELINSHIFGIAYDIPVISKRKYRNLNIEHT